MERFVVLLCILLVQVLSKHKTLQQNTTDGEEWRNSDDNETDTSTTTLITTPTTTPTTTSTITHITPPTTTPTTTPTITSTTTPSTTPITTPKTTLTTTTTTIPTTTPTTAPTTAPTLTPTTTPTTTSIETPTTSATTTEEPNPCNLTELPALPLLFQKKTSSHRISEIKCFEYIWDVKRKEIEKERFYNCQEYLLQKNAKSYLPKEPPMSVIGGRAAYIGELPHMAAIGWKASVGTWVFKCGGSLISRNFVLTAAHCSRASNIDTTIADVEPKIVRLGHSNIVDSTYININREAPADAIIVRFINHPNYKPPKKYFDIALIELEKDVAFTEYVQPACLNIGPDDVLVGKIASLAGWGVVEIVDKTTSPLLQTAKVNVIDSQICDKLLRPSCNRNWCGINETQLCAGVYAGGIDACQGDSGGPLYIKNSTTIYRRTYSVIGVTSFGVGCALPDLPGVYTRVSSFVDWIEDIVWK